MKIKLNRGLPINMTSLSCNIISAFEKHPTIELIWTVQTCINGNLHNLINKITFKSDSNTVQCLRELVAEGEDVCEENCYENGDLIFNIKDSDLQIQTTQIAPKFKTTIPICIVLPVLEKLANVLELIAKQ